MKTSQNFNDTKKKEKKTKSGKKNWKNIDISELEATNRIKAKSELQTKQVTELKDEALFTIDSGKVFS